MLIIIKLIIFINKYQLHFYLLTNNNIITDIRNRKCNRQKIFQETSIINNRINLL